MLFIHEWAEKKKQERKWIRKVKHILLYFAAFQTVRKWALFFEEKTIILIQSSAFKWEERLKKKIFGAFSYTVKILKEKNLQQNKDTKKRCFLVLIC